MSNSTIGPRDALASLKIDRDQADARRSGWRWLLAGVTLLILVGGVGVAARQSGLAARLTRLARVSELMQTTLEVRTGRVTVETGRAADAVVVASGYIESRRQAKIGARQPGRIEVVHVEEGTVVTKDQVLASLEHADLDASLAAAQATLARSQAELVEHRITVHNLQRELERSEKLWQAKRVTDAEYDKAKTQWEIAVARSDSLRAAIDLSQARVREAEQLKANVFIRAPFDGTVISKDAEVGESILPGGMGEASGRGSVVTIADLQHLEVDCDVKEDYISRIREGQQSEVAVDAVPDRKYAGRVRKIIPMGDRARATIKVKVEILDVDGRLFPEMSGTVRFLTDASVPTDSQARRIFCPREAIVTGPENGTSHVWTITPEKKVRRVSVTLGNQRDTVIEITTGLTGNELVVLAPPTTLTDQQPIKPIQN